VTQFFEAPSTVAFTEEFVRRFAERILR